MAGWNKHGTSLKKHHTKVRVEFSRILMHLLNKDNSKYIERMAAMCSSWCDQRCPMHMLPCNLLCCSHLRRHHLHVICIVAELLELQL